MPHCLLRESATNKVRWLKAKCLKFQQAKVGIIEVRYSHEDEYESVNVFGRNRATTYNLTKAYKSQLPITMAKYRDLQKLCTNGIVPKELHTWYAELPTSTNAVDTTPEPAIKDSGDEVE